MPKHPPIEHELDAAWIIALWILIHDGDPPPSIEQIAMEAVAALSTTVLNSNAGPVGNVAEFQSRFKELGIQMEVPKEAKGGVQTEDIVINRTYCFTANGQRICITFKRTFWPPPGR